MPALKEAELKVKLEAWKPGDNPWLDTRHAVIKKGTIIRVGKRRWIQLV